MENIESGNAAGSRDPLKGMVPSPKARLRDQFHEVCRFRRVATRTEETYWAWVRRFLRFHKQGQAWRHPRELGASEVRAFLTHLAVTDQVAASTQNQALNALVFLYRQVLGGELGDFRGFERARRPVRLPVVLTREEVVRLLAVVPGAVQLPVRLLYGSGLRLMELLRLRVKDLDLERRQLTVREGKGDKDRVTMIPESLVELLRAHLVEVRAWHEADRRAGAGRVWLPEALARKYPNAAMEWGWQWVFPMATLSQDPASGELRRHHLLEDGVQRDGVGPGILNKCLTPCGSQAVSQRAGQPHPWHNLCLPPFAVGSDPPFRSCFTPDSAPLPSCCVSVALNRRHPRHGQASPTVLACSVQSESSSDPTGAALARRSGRDTLCRVTAGKVPGSRPT